MKRYNSNLLIIISSFLLIAGVFLFSGCGNSKGHNSASENETSYHCPMHPSYTSKKPGDCPICGMKLIKTEAPAADESSEQEIDTADQPQEKLPEEVCISHQCTMSDCTMNVNVHIRSGEKYICPICGDVVYSENGKVIDTKTDDKHKESMEGAKKEKRILYYRNPMNSEMTSPLPMKDSMGMDYIPVYEQEKAAASYGGPTVMKSPERQQMIGIKTETVKVRDLVRIIRVSGKIAYDPDLAVAQEEFIQALNVQDSIKDSALKDISDRAVSITDAARNKLRLLGMNDYEIEILEKTRKAETSLYLPKKGESVWAYILVYEYELGFVKVGDSVDIEAVAYPGEKFMGKIVSINPVLDSATRTNQVRVKIAEHNNKLKPEMFVNAIIKGKIGLKLALPVSAVLDTGLRKIVYLSEPNNILESHEVVLGQKAENYYEVLSGLKEGDVVVTSGNFLVDSESKLKSHHQVK